MTVTQMSNHVDVTKANLYHFVREMVKDGLLAKPEIRVKKNYVEKYYRLSEAAFKSVGPLEAQEKLSESKPEECRAILESFLTSLGLHLYLLAEQVKRAEDEKLAAIASAFKERMVVLHYSILGDAAYAYELKEYRRITKKSIERWGQKSESLSGNGNRLIIIGLPQLRTDLKRTNFSY